MRDAAVPSDDQQVVARQHVSKYIRVGKDRAEHRGPSHYALAIHRARSEQIVTVKERFAHQRSSDSMCDGIHNFFGYFSDERLEVAILEQPVQSRQWIHALVLRMEIT
jgi:transcriptional accessory protein Tex/SPT6